jgi:hypothetical protein
MGITNITTMTLEEEFDSIPVDALGIQEYMVFVPQGGNEFLIGHVETMVEMGLGFPYETEVFYGSKEQCLWYIETHDFNNFIMIQSKDNKGVLMVCTPRNFEERGYAEDWDILFKGNYIDCRTEMNKLFVDVTPSHEDVDKTASDLPF